MGRMATHWIVAPVTPAMVKNVERTGLLVGRRQNEVDQVVALPLGGIVVEQVHEVGDDSLHIAPLIEEHGHTPAVEASATDGGSSFSTTGFTATAATPRTR